MKKNKLLEWTFIALATITSCTNDTVDIYTQENEIKLTSEITPSRVTSLDYQSTQIVKDQQVGVTITGAKSEHKNVAWNVGEEGELSNTGGSIFWANEDIAITAYHPYNSSWTGTSHEFSVSTDQSSEESYRNSDLLWAAATSSKTETAIPLIFSHKLAKINVTLKSEDIEDLSGATINICGTNITTNFNPVDGTLSAATANVQEIKAGVTTSTAYTASAIVVPQTVANGTKFIKITHNDRTFYYTLSTNKELKSGCSHNYTLTIKEKEVTTESDKITDWEDDDNEGDAEEIETIPNNQIWYTSSDGNVITPKTGVFSVNITSNVYENGKGIITFDNSVTTIGDNAFYGRSNLTSLILPNSVSSIGKFSFYNCTNLASLTIGENITEIGYEAFKGCTGKLIINSNIPDRTISSEDWFYRSSFSEVVFGKSVTKIGNFAFYKCSSLTSVTIPDNVTMIGEWAFRETQLTNVTIPNSVTTIGECAFYGCYNLTNIVIPNSVTKIASATFSNCVDLTNVIIPNSVATIEESAFFGCEKLTNITIGNNVTLIGRNAFYGCKNISNITIPNSVKTIGSGAFSNCYNLTNIVFGESVTEIGFGTFYNCTSLTSVTLPNSLLTVGDAAFYACEKIEKFIGKYAEDNGRCLIMDNKIIAYANASGTTYIIPDNVTSIGECAFYYCYNLTSVTIPNSVTIIGNGAFFDCRNLTSLTIGENVSEIGCEAFDFCDYLKRVDIKTTTPPILDFPIFQYCNKDLKVYVPAESIETYRTTEYWKDLNLYTETIPDNQIWYTSSDGNVVTLNYTDGFGAEFKSNIYENGKGIITFDGNVTKIRSWSFNGKTNLTSVIIPNSVTSIEFKAFDGCFNLANVTILNNVSTIEGGAFARCSSLKNIIIPNGLTTIAQGTFENCSSLVNCIIPDGVTKIDADAFKNCTSLVEIIIPSSVTNIGSCAFYNCSSLKKIYCNAANPPIGDYSLFYNVPKYTCSLYVPKGSKSKYKVADYWKDFDSIIEK